MLDTARPHSMLYMYALHVPTDNVHTYMHAKKGCLLYQSAMMYNIFGISQHPFYPDSLDEHYLHRVFTAIKSLHQVQSLGLALALLAIAIKEIRAYFSLVKEQKIEIIKRWLKRMQIIHKMQGCSPTYSRVTL